MCHSDQGTGLAWSKILFKREIFSKLLPEPRADDMLPTRLWKILSWFAETFFTGVLRGDLVQTICIVVTPESDKSDLYTVQ